MLTSTNFISNENSYMFIADNTRTEFSKLLKQEFETNVRVGTNYARETNQSVYMRDVHLASVFTMIQLFAIIFFSFKLRIYAYRNISFHFRKESININISL